MTEIDVVKKSSNVWIWVVLAILILAALFFFTRSRSDTRTGQRLIDRVQPTTPAAILIQV